MNNSTKPKLFLYSLILPVIWLGFGTLFSQIFPEQNLGLMGLVIILYIALLPVSWHFAKHYERQFVKNEKIRLIKKETLNQEMVCLPVYGAQVYGMLYIV